MSPLVVAIEHTRVGYFAMSAFEAAFTPTFQATIPDVLPDENDYTRALSGAV
jgi:hypothetical protein